MKSFVIDIYSEATLLWVKGLASKGAKVFVETKGQKDSVLKDGVFFTALVSVEDDFNSIFSEAKIHGQSFVSALIIKKKEQVFKYFVRPQLWGSPTEREAFFELNYFSDNWGK